MVEEALTTLKESFAAAAVLIQPNTTQQFIAEADALDQISGMLQISSLKVKKEKSIHGLSFLNAFPHRTGSCWQWLWRNDATNCREPSSHLSSGLTKKPCLSQSGQTSEFPRRPFSWRGLTVFLLTDPTLGTSDPFSVSSCAWMPPQYHHYIIAACIAGFLMWESESQVPWSR